MNFYINNLLLDSIVLVIKMILEVSLKRLIKKSITVNVVETIARINQSSGSKRKKLQLCV